MPAPKCPQLQHIYALTSEDPSHLKEVGGVRSRSSILHVKHVNCGRGGALGFSQGSSSERCLQGQMRVRQKPARTTPTWTVGAVRSRNLKIALVGYIDNMSIAGDCNAMRGTLYPSRSVKFCKILTVTGHTLGPRVELEARLEVRQA